MVISGKGSSVRFETYLPQVTESIEGCGGHIRSEGLILPLDRSIVNVVACINFC